MFDVRGTANSEVKRAEELKVNDCVVVADDSLAPGTTTTVSVLRVRSVELVGDDVNVRFTDSTVCKELTTSQNNELLVLNFA